MKNVPVPRRLRTPLLIFARNRDSGAAKARWNRPGKYGRSEGGRLQFGIILIHDTDKNIKFPIVEAFFHFIGGFIAELDLDIRPFRVESRQNLRKTDLSAVDRIPSFRLLMLFSEMSRDVLEFMFLGEDLHCNSVELFPCIGEGELWLPVKERDTVVLFQTLDMLA